MLARPKDGLVLTPWERRRPEGRPLRQPCSEGGQVRGMLGGGCRSQGQAHAAVLWSCGSGAAGLPGCPLFPPVRSSVAETTEGAVDSATTPLADLPTFGGCGSGTHLTSGSCSVPCPSAALLPVAAQRGCPARP